MTQQIQFTKMHGLGNDFIVIDAINQSIVMDKTLVRVLADRHLGIGFDQLLLVEKSHNADFACRIFNADGTLAEQCGNGIRCVARFIQEEALSNTKKITIGTAAGILDVIIHGYDKIQVNMGTPLFEPKKIPFIAEKRKTLYEIKMTADTVLPVAVLSMGNPHAILQTASIKNLPAEDVANQIASHTSFPQGVNVGFIEINNRDHIHLRTFERGVGETFACGSNACAAVVAGIANGWLNNSVTVQLPYGNLFVEWQGDDDQPVIMTGPATRVFTGQVIV